MELPLFEVLTRHLLASTVLLGATGLACLLMRVSAALRHRMLIWALALAAVVPAAHTFLPAWPVLPGTWTDRGKAPRVLVADVDPGVRSGVSPGLSGSSTRSRSPLGTLTILASFLWAAMFALRTANVVIALARQGRLRRRIEPLDPETLRILEESRRRLNLNRGLDAGFADVSMPLACGLLRSLVVLPRRAAGWSIERRRAVLMHELAHVRRRDPAMRVFAQVLGAANALQPLAWWAVWRLKREQELAADDLVCDGGIPRVGYAQHLLDIAAGVDHRETSVAAVPAVGSGGLDHRIRAILAPPGPSRRVGVSAFLPALAAGALLLATAARSAGESQAVADGFWRPQGVVFDEQGRVIGVMQQGPAPLVVWIMDAGTIATEGDVRFTRAGVASIGPLGFLLLEVSDGPDLERVEVRSGPNGALAIRRTRNGRAVDGTEAELWLERHLPDCLAEAPLTDDGRLLGASSHFEGSETK